MACPINAITIAAALLAMLILPQAVLASQIGVSPSVIDAGNMAPGESKTLSLGVFTTLNEKPVVYMDVGSINKDVAASIAHGRGLNYSEEKTNTWLEFINNPVELSPGGIAGIESSGMIGVNFILGIPRDAEPGFHMISITPMPVSPESRGMGASMVSVARVNVFFNVPGNAVSAGHILDILAYRSPGDVRVNAFFQNTGSLTSEVYLSRLSLFYTNGSLAASTTSEFIILKPGDIGKFTAIFPARVPNGNYTVMANFLYQGNEEAKNFTVELSGRPQTFQAQGNVIAAPPDNTLMVVIILVFAVAGAVSYRKLSRD